MQKKNYFKMPNYDQIRSVEPHKQNSFITLFFIPEMFVINKEDTQVVNTLKSLYSDEFSFNKVLYDDEGKLISNPISLDSFIRSSPQIFNIGSNDEQISQESLTLNDVLSLQLRDVNFPTQSINTSEFKQYNGQKIVYGVGLKKDQETFEQTFKETKENIIKKMMDIWKYKIVNITNSQTEISPHMGYKQNVIKIDFDYTQDINLNDKSQGIQNGTLQDLLENRTRIQVLTGVFPTIYSENSQNIQEQGDGNVTVTFSYDLLLNDIDLGMLDEFTKNNGQSTSIIKYIKKHLELQL